MNTLSDSFTMRNKYFQSQYNIVLRNALVAEKICTVDNSDLKTLQNPYGSQPTATLQAVAGTYTKTAWTVTDDYLTVADEVTYAEQVYAHEEFFAKFDIAQSRIDNMMYAIAFGIDKFVLNKYLDQATGTYTTPTGGFTTGGNIVTIMANLISKVAGYAEAYKGMFLVIENTDLVGFAIAGATTGFNMADSVLKNGFMNSYMGVDIYVIRTGTFVTDTLGTLTATNSGHRLFGIKNTATYASPRGLQYVEKDVTLVTGKEINVFGLVGFNLWVPARGLNVDITLA